MASFAASNQQEAPSTLPQDAAACKNGGIGGLFLQCGYDTDIGGGRENQDDCFIWRQPGAGGTSVLCVLDGHGREVGRIAANAARASLREYFDARFQMLRTNPYECLVEAHEVAHRRIKAAFREELEGEGYEVEEAPEGYLLKRMPPSQAWGCVHGGSSCSIVALVDHMIYIANVGDSSGTLSCSVPVLSSGLLKHLGDAANMTSFAGGSGKEAASSSSSSSSLPSCLSAANAGFANGLADDHGASSSSMAVDTDIAILVPQDNLVITAEHGPESPSEFCRLRTFRPKPGDPMQPALAVVYDSPSADKAKCTPVFVLDDAGVPTAINKGKYYKNVRKEWASLVSTPSTARFQDALAFTRSLGDLHLHTFGVTHLPEVQMIDLREVFSSIEGKQKPLSSDSSPPPSVVCIVLATDGVWDNWTYEDVTRFVMDASCLSAVNAGPDGAERVAKAFMQRNSVYARRNFGAQADNATGIVVYISDSPSLPHD